MQPNRDLYPLCSVADCIMNKILLIVAVLAGFSVGNLYAQNREDILYLKNGSIYRGKVTETMPGVHATIQISGRSTFVVPDSAIKLILINQLIPSEERTNGGSQVEMAADVNFYGGSTNSAGFTFVTSYLFLNRLSTGVGLGTEWFAHQQLPFMADVRYYLLPGSWSPCIYVLGGYAVPLSNNEEGDYSKYSGGMLAGVGAGMRFNFSRRNAIVFNLGYRYQKTKTVSGYNPYYSEYETIVYDKYNRLTFSFGFLFN